MNVLERNKQKLTKSPTVSQLSRSFFLDVRELKLLINDTVFLSRKPHLIS